MQNKNNDISIFNIIVLSICIILITFFYYIAYKNNLISICLATLNTLDLLGLYFIISKIIELIKKLFLTDQKQTTKQ